MENNNTVSLNIIAFGNMSNIPVQMNRKKKKPKNRKTKQMHVEASGQNRNPWAASMPHPEWGGADYSYASYQTTSHQNIIRPDYGATWRPKENYCFPREGLYDNVDPYNRPHPSSTPSFVPHQHPPEKRKNPGEPVATHNVPLLNLQGETSTQKIYIRWNQYTCRKDVYYFLSVVCVSSACNFQKAGEGHKWTFEQAFTQNQRCLTTTPGNVYKITLECRELTTKKTIVTEEKEFKACMNLLQHEEMYRKAVIFAGHSMHHFEVLYRCKPKVYWDYIHVENNGWMEKYIKDNNGQPSNQINGHINGLFFSARLAPDGNLPTSSPFGDVRMIILADKLLHPELHNFYFADFYCNYVTHYVTIVVCVKGSETDKFCATRCHPLDIFNNPFLKLSRPWNPHTNTFDNLYFVNKVVWVEIYYTENIHLDIGHFDYIVATGAGTSKIGGLPNNKLCSSCNLFTIKQPVPVKLGKIDFNSDDIDNSLDITALDLTTFDDNVQNSTFRVLCEQDKGGLEEYWDDLVEVVCSIVDGACELRENEKEEDALKTISSDVIKQADREIAQLIKDTEAEIGSSPILKAVPQLDQAWKLVKDFVERFKTKVNEIQELVDANKILIKQTDTAKEQPPAAKRVKLDAIEEERDEEKKKKKDNS